MSSIQASRNNFLLFSCSRCVLNCFFLIEFVTKWRLGHFLCVFTDEPISYDNEIDLIDVAEKKKEEKKRRRERNEPSSDTSSSPEAQLLAMFKKQGIPTHFDDVKQMILTPPSKKELVAAREAIERSLSRNKILTRVVSSDSSSSSSGQLFL